MATPQPRTMLRSHDRDEVVTGPYLTDEPLFGAGRREAARRGRGAVSNPPSRLCTHSYEPHQDQPEAHALDTEVTIEKARSIITKNDSPDIAFERSLNPYRGCEHGCVYCYARPNHAYMGLSPGLDFETKLFAKINAPELLEKELSAPGYQPKVLALGAATDPYQPVERSYRLTRSVLEILARARHPVAIVTKSGLITRDLDLLAPMAERGLVKVALSLSTLDPHLARKMEPRAPTPARRLEAIRQLSEAGIPVSVMVAPVIPALTDPEIERILEASHASGASNAGYVLLRLPHETATLMRDWLTIHYPDKARRVLSLLQESRGGKVYDANFKTRMTGAGPYAWMLGRRFELACTRLGLNKRPVKLRTDLFRPPSCTKAEQLSLF